MKGKLLILGITPVFLITTSVFSATEINLRQQPASILTTLPTHEPMIQLKELSRSVGPNQTLHVRVQETYQHYPIWKADAVIHIPDAGNTSAALSDIITKNTYMNGIWYNNLESDLANTPNTFFTSAQADKALQLAKSDFFQQLGSKPDIKDSQSILLVYIDNNNKAHWAYRVSFYAEPVKSSMAPAKPVYIIDTNSMYIYEKWDEIQTLSKVSALGGGIGGNKKAGKVVYDGLPNHLSRLNIQRDAATSICYLSNTNQSVNDASNKYQLISYTCNKIDTKINAYWRDKPTGVNGGFSPSDDALYGGAVAIEMYKNWYNMPLMTRNGKHQILVAVVHIRDYEGAYWDGSFTSFGDGKDKFFPHTSLGIVAHESSHAFTSDHSKLIYKDQSGGMNEAYSDMAAQAIELYKYGNPSWQIGKEVSKKGISYRFMDMPSKNCNGGIPGAGCSINTIDQYYKGLDVHYSSGIYDRVYYMLSISPTWNARKAFQVMMDANVNYWTSGSTFKEGACGVIKATKDRGYTTLSVTSAFNSVNINTSDC